MARSRHVVMTAILMALPVLGLPAPGVAVELPPTQVNGFLSQGYLESSGNQYLLSHSKDGSTQLSEVGVTVTSIISDRLRLGFQYLARDLGDEGNHSVQLDWGYGEYRISNALGLRLGKVKLPIGLYNEGRDSEFLRPTAFLPQSVYDELNRDFLTAAAGVGIFGNIWIGSGGSLDYSLFAGEINFDPDGTMGRLHLGNINSALQSGLLGTVLPPATDWEFESDMVPVGRVVYNTPMTGLRLGLTYADLGGVLELQSDHNPYQQVLDGLGLTGVPGRVRVDYEDMTVVSAEYLSAPLELRCEYQSFRLKVDALGTYLDDQRAQGWYLMATAPLPGLKDLTATALYDVIYKDAGDRGGDRFAAGGLDRHQGWKKDRGLGLRYDVSDNFALKGEYHQVDGIYSVLGTMALLNDNRTDRFWEYLVLKGSFNF